MGKPKILLADDDADLLQDIQRLLESDFEVVVAVGDGQALIEVAQALTTDIIIADITMPLRGGFQAVRCIKADRPNARVIFLTVHSEPAFVEQARRMDVLGYVIKQCIPSCLIPAIREVLQDRPFVCTAVQE